MSSATPPEPALLQEAADWAMTLHYGAPGDAERQAFAQWHGQSPRHAAAWSRAEAVFQTFRQVPAAIGKDALQELEHSGARRRGLQALGLLLVAAPAGWLAWRQLPWGAWTADWRADVATAAGERKALTLADGSRLVLNTASAVDVLFSATERRIRLLAGEILVSTHPDAAPVHRPFLVDTSCGVVRALGTRFSVRRLDDANCHVAVFEKAVEIRPLGGAPQILHAGEQARFDERGLRQPEPVEAGAALWEQGMLLARDLPLGEVIAELARYRSGVLRCDPAVAGLRVSGAVSLADTDAALQLLANTLPIRVERRTRFWVTVTARG